MYTKTTRLTRGCLFFGGELGIRTLGEFPHTAFRDFRVKWNVVELKGTKWYQVELKNPTKTTGFITETLKSLEK